MKTGKTLAIKKVYQDKGYQNRELRIMKELDSPHIVKFYGHFYSSDLTEENAFLNLVLEYIPGTVHRLTRTFVKSREHVPNVLVKVILFFILAFYNVNYTDNM